MDRNTFGPHQSHSEPKERFGQVGQIVNPSPFNIGNLELRVFMIAEVFVDDIS